MSNFKFRTNISFNRNPQFAAQVLEILENYNYLKHFTDLPDYTPESISCFQLEDNEKFIQSIATSFRNRLGLGEAPITNLFQSIEAIGLKVIRQSIPIKDFFGLSAYSNLNGAFILVNTYNSSIEYQLFTLANEIGHLIFNRLEYQLIKEETKQYKNSSNKVADYFANHLLVSQIKFEQMYSLTQNIINLKRYFRVGYLVILNHLASIGIINFAQEKAKICEIYKKQHNGKSLQTSMEFLPILLSEQYPENELYKYLIWHCLKIGKISKIKAAKLLNLTLEQLLVHYKKNEVYSIKI